MGTPHLEHPHQPNNTIQSLWKNIVPLTGFEPVTHRQKASALYQC